MVEYDRIYVVIVTFNGMQWIEKCLSSCAPYHVVVVDNNSSDGTVWFITQIFPKTTILKQHENLGFGAANNKGISFALREGAEAVFLLNQDAYLFPDTIEKIADFNIENPDFGILSPVHYQLEKEKLDPQFSNYISYGNNNYFISDAINGCLKTVYEVPFVNAASWFLPRKTLETIGGFDPIFFHYGEDDNYCQRVRYHDLKIGVVTNTEIIHDRGERKVAEIKPYSQAYCNKLERAFKLHYANVNRKDISFKDKFPFSLLIPAILKFDLTRVDNILKLRRLKKRWYKKSLKSRSNNQKRGSAYLEI